jgi:proline iminopeptidase
MTLYPPIDPYATDRVDVGAGHELHVEQAGNPAGIPVVFLHGGPGGGLIPRCAGAWMRWEAVNSTLVPDPALIATLTADDTVLHAARILAHYAVNNCFFATGTALLDGVDRIRHLPAVIVQGRYDLCCPPVSAYDLARRWPGADLQMVADAGHSSLEPGITDRLVRATDRFADVLSPSD